MPRYFFHLADHQLDPDQTGTELADDGVARIQALVFAGTYLRDHPDQVWDGYRLRVIVMDERQQGVLTVSVEAHGTRAS